MSSLRLRVLIATSGVALAPLLALSSPGTASASPVASPAPCLPAAPICPSVDPSPSPTVEPTTPAPVVTTAPPTPSPTPSRTADATHSPAPRATFAVPAGSTANPVTASIDVGVVAQTSESPLATSASTEPASSSRGTSTLYRLIELVLLGAVVLLLGGALGLYLTRHQRGH